MMPEKNKLKNARDNLLPRLLVSGQGSPDLSLTIVGGVALFYRNNLAFPLFVIIFLIRLSFFTCETNFLFAYTIFSVSYTVFSVLYTIFSVQKKLCTTYRRNP